MKKFVISDIHGACKTFKQLLKDIQFSKKDELYLLGDYIEVDNYILVHAGLNFDMPDPFEVLHSMIWIRRWEDNIDKNWLDGRIIIHGHTPAKKNVIEDRLLLLEQLSSLSIDNGCVFPYAGLGRLCAFELGERTLVFRAFMD